MNLIHLYSLLLFARYVSGWGQNIHREITNIALRHVSKNKTVKRYLFDHLGSEKESVLRASTWADSEEAFAKYPGSEDLHFSNTPWRDCQPFNLSRDCGFDGSGECIVSGIAKYVMIASDPSQPLQIRADALKFVMHLVADIHQPLHTGFAEDNGGVNIQIGGLPALLSLHQMWDFEIFETAIAAGVGASSLVDSSAPSIEGLIAFDDSLEVPSQVSTYEEWLNFTSLIASESSLLLTCRFAYQFDDGSYIKSRDMLSPEYLASRHAIITSRIELAGQRLASVLGAVALSFRRRTEESSSTISTPMKPHTSTSCRNPFALLPIEFEPEDYVASVSEEETSPRSSSYSATTPSSSYRSKKPKRKELQLVSTETGGPFRIGALEDINQVVLLKRRERYIVTCRRLADSARDYEPMHVLHFRVRFAKNRRQTDPIVFLADVVCFGASLNQKEFVMILYHLSGNDALHIPHSLALGTSATLVDRGDDLDIAAVRNEVVMKGYETEDRTYRGWNPFYFHDQGSVRSYLRHLDALHIANQVAQYKQAEAKNISIYEKWDLDFYSKFRDVLVYRYGRLQVVIHRHSLLDPKQVELMFVIYKCVSTSPLDDVPSAGSGENPAFTTLVDTTIYDGYITPRILKGMGMRVRAQTEFDQQLTLIRPTFFAELQDVDSILHGRGIARADGFNAIHGFYMFPSAVSRSVAYIEWSIIPTKFEAINTTNAAQSSAP